MYYSYTKMLCINLLWYLNEKGSIVDALVTVFSYEVCIILLLREFKIKINSKCILYRIYIIISVLVFFPFKYFKQRFLYYQKKCICENVTVSVLMLNFADFFPPYSILSVKLICRVLSAGHVTCHQGKVLNSSAQRLRASALLSSLLASLILWKGSE